MYPKSLQNLIDDFKALPGVGEKTAERFAFWVLDSIGDFPNQFANDLVLVKQKIKYCEVCGNITEGIKCSICEDDRRNKRFVCVVQQPKDVFAIEKTDFRGVYHVLHGALSTTKGILPDDLNIRSLIKRLEEGVDEVVIATNPTLDGETTALYLAKILKDMGINVTRLAHGLSMGSSLDYADELTLIKAMEGRTKQ